MLTAIRNISLADAVMSILPMQTSMIASFENDSEMDRELMTILTGTGICVVFLLLGISMIIQAKK